MAAWGGRRAGAGRKYSGAKTVAVAKLLRERAANNPDGKVTEMPLDFLIRVMRSEDQPMGLRVDCAKAAAPYISPRLQSIDVTSEEDRTVRIEFVDFSRNLILNKPSNNQVDQVKQIVVDAALADDTADDAADD